ncbi:PAQR family membrane homeostasis protein TrhA [Aliidiomarina maris]|uniref:Hemolysin III n=1 Tax=Aliidiomarina maris TaxID=531312 RepID=A0A327X1N1_9GAMM|nr:hemolysin III family protein [Aliidiomarina maris]MBA3987912.1 hemolysin III [Idiomarina sp.]MCL5051331.1 hemolysin III family protein [Bacillota bacterium]RAJ96353.1 hemolysin III [Aliidiomarina maris]RUO22868.1 hemolysin III [Aliidiomarina maris]
MGSAKYSLGEEIANSVSHGIGALLSMVGLGFLIWLSVQYGDVWHVVSTAIYGTSLVLLYSASTLYHAIPHPKAKRVFQLLDHSMIFVLIAGTYTPFALVSLRGPWGWTLFGVVWGIAIAGIILETVKKERIKWLSLSLYLGLGWMAIVVIKPMIDSVPSVGLLFLLAGGLSYSLGVVFYVRKQMLYHHAIWHMFVMAGSALHFCAVLFGVVLADA